MRLHATRAAARTLVTATRAVQPRRAAAAVPRHAPPAPRRSLAVCAGDATPSSSSPTVTLAVTGMVCSKCSDRVAAALAKVDGVATATADHKAGTASVALAPGAAVDAAALAATVTGIGFEAKAA